MVFKQTTRTHYLEKLENFFKGYKNHVGPAGSPAGSAFGLLRLSATKHLRVTGSNPGTNYGIPVIRTGRLGLHYQLRIVRRLFGFVVCWLVLVGGDLHSFGAVLDLTARCDEDVEPEFLGDSDNYKRMRL